MELIGKTFNVDASDAETEPSYNIAPTQKVLGVRQLAQRELVSYHWGLVPFWAKDVSIGSRMINARAETADQKPSFRHAFRKRRCLIVADGFYEWKGEKGQKKPWFIRPKRGHPFAFAGLWEIWQPESPAPYQSCTIMTTSASPSLCDIHHRMPAILRPEAYEAWLNPYLQDVEAINDILQSQLIDEFTCHPVSTRVNSVRNNDPACIDPQPQPST